MTEVTLMVTFVLESCVKCGISWGVPSEWLANKRRNHSSFYCPNGHSQHYPGESDISKAYRLKAEAERHLQAQLNEANHAKLVAEKERDAANRAKRKVERRIAHGVCPCCNQTFADIANHMLTEHKDFRLPEGKRPKQITGAA